jgi:hypothetical protein
LHISDNHDYDNLTTDQLRQLNDDQIEAARKRREAEKLLEIEAQEAAQETQWQGLDDDDDELDEEVSLILFFYPVCFFA